MAAVLYVGSSQPPLLQKTITDFTVMLHGVMGFRNTTECKFQTLTMLAERLWFTVVDSLV